MDLRIKNLMSDSEEELPPAMMDLYMDQQRRRREEINSAIKKFDESDSPFVSSQFEEFMTRIINAVLPTALRGCNSEIRRSNRVTVLFAVDETEKRLSAPLMRNDDLSAVIEAFREDLGEEKVIKF